MSATHDNMENDADVVNCLNFEKIFYHPEHLQALLDTGEAFPLHLELGVVNYCNHDCAFCYAARSRADVRGKKRENIDTVRIVEIIAEMAGHGLRSVTLVGSGEPTLHPAIDTLLRKIHEHEVDVAMFTNGSKLQGAAARAVLDCCTFVRISLTGATPEVHHRVHGTNDYEKITENIRQLVRARGVQHHPTIGIQFILASYSATDAVRAAEQARDMGVDYFEIKPCFPAPEKGDQPSNELSTDEALAIMEQAEAYETPEFRVFTKAQQVATVFARSDDRTYDDCLGSCTCTCIETDLRQYICDNQKSEDFCIGSLRDRSFSELWNSEQRKRIIASLNVHRCPPGCRMDPLNRIIYDIRTGGRSVPIDLPPAAPGIHANFL